MSFIGHGYIAFMSGFKPLAILSEVCLGGDTPLVSVVADGSEDADFVTVSLPPQSVDTYVAPDERGHFVSVNVHLKHSPDGLCEEFIHVLEYVFNASSSVGFSADGLLESSDFMFSVDGVSHCSSFDVGLSGNPESIFCRMSSVVESMESGINES